MQPTLAPAPQSRRSSAQDNAADQSLREHLLAQVHNSHSIHKPELPPQASISPNPLDHNIDPAIAGSAMVNTSAGESGGDENGSDGRKGAKRELSTSKRAAQNRAAQRAFRQRKEGHIKQLEAQVKDYTSLSESFKMIQAENYQLRDYIISLQSRLLDTQGEFPQPPSNIEIPQPGSSSSHEHSAANTAVVSSAPSAPTASMGSSAISQMQAAAAQAVADLGKAKHQREESSYLTRSPITKRPRMAEGTDVRSALASQLGVTNAETQNRPVVA